MKHKILVTGGTGYIGSHTTIKLIEAGHEVFIIDNLSNSDKKVIDRIEKITGVKPLFFEADCTDINLLKKFFEENPGIDGIINFAASKAVGESVEKPLLYYRNNLLTLINLLELGGKYGVKGLVFSSSCTVYGEPDNNPIDESAPIKEATSPYGNTKQISEEIIRDFINSGASIKSIILRYFNPIGAHPSGLLGEKPNGIPQNILPYMVQTAAGIRECLTVFGDDYGTPDGSCIRDYIDINDLADAHVVAMERMLDNPESPQIEYFNIGTGRGLSVFELIEAFNKANDLKIPVKVGARRKGDIEQIWADATKANQILKWKAVVPIEQTMQSVWKWQQNLSKEL